MKKIIATLFILFLFSSTLLAAPPIIKGRPEPLELPGKMLQERFAPQVPAGLMLAPSTVPTGTVNILFLRVDFPSDLNSLTTGTGLWSDPTYSTNGSSDYWVNSAKTRFVDYWKEVSYGLLPISIDISSKVYRLINPMVAYGNETSRDIENLIYDSITAALPDTTFSNYDAVLIIHAGLGEETDVAGNTPGDIWSLSYSSNCISQNAQVASCLTTTLKDGKPITEAIIMPQTDSQDGIVVDPLGVYVHEFGHWLGLPDLYCTAGSTCTIDGAGMWSLMGDGSYNYIDVPFTPTVYGSSPSHLDAWSLMYLGWVNPSQKVSGYESISLGPVESIPTPTTPAQGTSVIKAQASSSTASQYFLIENRQQVGFDEGLPGHGLLVWLVDDDVVTSTISANAVNNNAARPGIKLIEADGDWALLTYYGDTGSTGDPFPGSSDNTKLTPMTDPSSIPYTDYGWVNINNLTETTGTAGAVNFSIGFAPFPPQNLTVDNTTKTLTWDASEGAILYNIYKNESATPLASPGSRYYTDSAMQSNDFYEVTAVDFHGSESQATIGSISIEPSNGTKGCFIATAAYGSYLDPHVEILRNFRDRHLLTNRAGRLFVSLYYQFSPPMAEVISRHESLRSAARWVLTPIVLMTAYPALCVMVFGFAFFIMLARMREKRVKASAGKLS